MKRFVTLFAALVFLVTLVLQVNAIGGYYVIPGTEIYHSGFCEDVRGYYIEDILWFATLEETKNNGYIPCSYCSEACFDYESNETTYWISKDQKTQNALDEERIVTIFEFSEEEEEIAFDEASYNAGFDDGYESCQKEYSSIYNEGCENGYDIGYNAGYAKANIEAEDRLSAALEEKDNEFSQKINEAREETKIEVLLLCTLLGIPSVSAVTVYIMTIVQNRKK